MRKKTAAVLLCVLLLLGCGTAEAKETAHRQKPETVSRLKAVSYSYDKIRLTWEAVEGAEAYVIYRSLSLRKGYKKIGTALPSQTVWTDKKLKTGRTYYYRLRVQKESTEGRSLSGFSKSVKAVPRPGRIQNLSAEYRMAGTFFLKWKSVRGADGYQLQLKTASDRKWKNAYRFDENTVSYPREAQGEYRQKRFLKQTCARWDLTSGEDAFWFRVRAYHVENGKKVFGAFSTPLLTEPVWNSEKELIDFVQDWVCQNYEGYIPDDLAFRTPENSSWGIEWGNCRTISRYTPKEQILQDFCEYRLREYFEKNYFAQGAEAPAGGLYLRDLGSGIWRVWWLD